MQFEMNRTWAQAIALVQANFQLLAVIAGIFMLLPTVAMYFAMPDVLTLSAASGGDADAVAARVGAMVPALLVFGLIAMLLQSVGYLAMIALMGDERPTVSEAIGRGFRFLPTVIGALLLFMVGYVVFFLVFALVLGILGAGAGLASGGGQSLSGGIVAVMAVAYVALFVGILYLFVRMTLTMPVIVLESEYNPIRAIRRSWRLTGPRAWAILGFFVLLFIVYMVVAMVLMIVMSALGVAAGSVMGSGTLITISLMYGVIGMLAAMLFSAILVSMHGQLAGTSQRTIAETFE